MQLATSLLAFATQGAPLAANAGAATAAGAAGAAGTGATIANILGGAASLMSVFSGISAANASADALEAQAIDAEREIPLENIRGVQRRTSLIRDLGEAIGAQDVAYASSGVDLSFGSAAQARRDAFREADNAIAQDVGTQETRVTRLKERASIYRDNARKRRRLGLVQAGAGLVSTGAKLFT